MPSPSDKRISPPLVEVIRREKQLRLIIDRLLVQPDIDWRLRDLILEMCAVAYGSEKQQAQEILEYCREKVSFDETPQSKYAARELDNLRNAVDGLYCDKRSIPDHTGFHRYIPETASWIRDGDDA